METKIKEDEKSLQTIESISLSIEETLKLSPLFVSMPEDEKKVLYTALHKEGFC